MFAILQKYDFSSKSQLFFSRYRWQCCCLRYCKSTIFQANHNNNAVFNGVNSVVCDTAKVRFFKQITTRPCKKSPREVLFAILQKYDFSSKSQRDTITKILWHRCLRYCKSTIFQANHNPNWTLRPKPAGCLRYCKSTIFQANHNKPNSGAVRESVVCDTAKVRFFKQITTQTLEKVKGFKLFAILQKYDFSSKSQPLFCYAYTMVGCLRYCKSTIFQANHN